MSIKNGGPAFPMAQVSVFADERVECAAVTQQGLSIRDYFAANAMQGLITTAGGPCLLGLDGCEGITAKVAYQMADAMLRAREQQ